MQVGLRHDVYMDPARVATSFEMDIDHSELFLALPSVSSPARYICVNIERGDVSTLARDRSRHLVRYRSHSLRRAEALVYRH